MYCRTNPTNTSPILIPSLPTHSLSFPTRTIWLREWVTHSQRNGKRKGVTHCNASRISSSTTNASHVRCCAPLTTTHSHTHTLTPSLPHSPEAVTIISNLKPPNLRNKDKKRIAIRTWALSTARRSHRKIAGLLLGLRCVLEAWQSPEYRRHGFRPKMCTGGRQRKRLVLQDNSKSHLCIPYHTHPPMTLGTFFRHNWSSQAIGWY